MTKFLSDSGTPQVDEVLRDISTIDEEPIGIEASRSMTEHQDDMDLQFTSEHVLNVRLSMK